MKYIAYVVSDCRYGLDVMCEFGINVVEFKEENFKINYNKEDLEL
jgi:phosphotransferase system IIA component